MLKSGMPHQDAEKALKELKDQLRESSKQEQTMRKRMRLLQKELDLASRHQAEAVDQVTVKYHTILHNHIINHQVQQSHSKTTFTMPRKTSGKIMPDAFSDPKVPVLSPDSPSWPLTETWGGSGVVLTGQVNSI